MGDMTNLPVPTPLPVYLTDEQVDATLEGVAPGWYLARDLHPRYKAVAEARGWTVGSVKTLGEALYRSGLPRRKAHGHASAYEVRG